MYLVGELEGLVRDCGFWGGIFGYVRFEHGVDMIQYLYDRHVLPVLSIWDYQDTKILKLQNATLKLVS